MTINKLQLTTEALHQVQTIEVVNSLVDQGEGLQEQIDGIDVPAQVLLHNTDPESHPDLVAGFENLSTSVDAITADPANAVTQIWIPAQALQLVSGTATLGPITARLPVWLLPDTSNVLLSTAIRLPSHWATMNIRFVAANTSANSGNVLFVGGVHSWTIGESINVSPAESSVAATIPSTAWITTISTISAPLLVDPAKFTTLRIYRQGASVNDTLPNSVALFGVILEKAT